MALTIKKLRVPFTQVSQFRYEIYDGDNLYAVTDNEDRANKIAAAPEMYEALKQWNRFTANPTSKHIEEAAIELMDYAIDKAEGRA